MSHPTPDHIMLATNVRDMSELNHVTIMQRKLPSLKRCCSFSLTISLAKTYMHNITNNINNMYRDNSDANH